MEKTVQRTDVVTILRDQHAAIRRMIADVKSLEGDDRAKAFEFLVRLLAVHETSEEELVYPAVRMQSSDAKAEVEARKQEENEAKKALADLEGMDLQTPAFLEAFAAFAQDVDAHASAEERTIFPLLEAHKKTRELIAMGQMLVVAQAFAPTHPHRAAPEGALANLLVGPFVAMVDRVRDAIRDARR
jgi:hemerythrin superfamily protein